jgi:hypothetical protein
MKTHRTALAALAITFAAATAASADSDGSRQSGYSYIRAATGDVTVESRANGSVEARRNMPISSGDEIRTADAGRAEIALADGNLLHVGGGTSARFESLAAQQGESEDVSSIKLLEGSVILSTLGTNENEIPRIDTDDATVYVKPGSRVRVNADPSHGTVVIGRAGSAEVRTRQGSNTLRAGQYLMARGDEEPEISRGAFSHDRFDLWAAERIDMLSESHSASARYVDEEHASDVVALDGYGDWSYDGTYSTYVWSPRVSAGWAPYSSGCWYYTPVGLTWWSYDPWGWYPFHYGNWFFNAAWGRWCWAPGSVYSPAWVYWGYTPSYVGWCPIGYYSFYSPWWRTYYRNWGWGHRGGVAFAINGSFSTRSVDFRGWNFVGAKNFGATSARMEVIPGSSIADRLGDRVAISSRPIVVNARETGTSEAIRDFVRQAPRVIARTASTDSSRMAPVLARRATLPEATVEALRQHGVVAERGRLSGPGAADLAPRGALVDRSRSMSEPSAREPMIIERGRASQATGGRGDGRKSEERTISSPATGEDWRTRTADHAPEGRQPVERPGSRTAPGEDWRGRSGNAPSERPAPSARPSAAQSERSSADWRSRPEVAPARRVIDGAVPGHRAPVNEDARRASEAAPSREGDAPRGAPRVREEAPPSRPEPRSQPRIERAPPQRQAPPARSSGGHGRKTN